MMTESENTESVFRGLKFTASGLKRMDEYQTKFAHVLRSAIREQRPSFTDTVIEVTAADVDRALSGVKLVSTRKLNFKRMFYDLYAIIGIMATLGGIFYDRINVLVQQQPERLALIGVGIFTIIISVFGRRLVRVLSIERNTEDRLSFFVSDFDEKRSLRNLIAHAALPADEQLKYEEIMRYLQSRQSGNVRIRGKSGSTGSTSAKSEP